MFQSYIVIQLSSALSG